MSSIDDRAVRRMLEQLGKIPDRVVHNATIEMKKATPIRSGNARRKTYRKNDTTILADYAYAGRLDEGWSSQAPGGFTDPTIDYIEKSIYRDIGGL